jgi:hypothetical protein
MHVILLALGLVICVAGLVLIGLGIPNNAAAPGTLIIAGTVAAVGGLILTGLASAIRQLRRIAQLLEARPLPRALGPEPAEPRAPVSAPPVEPPLATESEPPPAAVPAPEPVHIADEDRRFRAGERSLRMVTEETSSVPEPDQHDLPEPAAEPPPPDRTPPPIPPPAKMTFDAPWTEERAADARPERPPASAPMTPTYGSDFHATAEPAEGVRIFKSGVIDGMAYTLYTDGSIEAELAQGTVKFASIDELRAYLAAREQ